MNRSSRSRWAEIRIRELSDDFLAQRGKNKVDDTNRWKREIGLRFSDIAVDAIGSPALAAMVTAIGEGPSAERALYLLSAFYRWAIRLGHVTTNPVTAYLASLVPADRKKLRSQHDSADTPYLDRREDVGRLYRKLPEPINIAYVLSAMAGLRPGEVVGLEWADVDLKKGVMRIRRQVRHGKVTTPKSGKARDVPLAPDLKTALKAWHSRNPGARLVVPPLRGEDHLGPASIQDALDTALASLKLPRLTFYQAGRHTFASQWVEAGLDIYRLSKILGHAAVTTTQRYARLAKAGDAEAMARANVRLSA